MRDPYVIFYTKDDVQTKETEIVENEDFEYCLIFPSLVGFTHFETSSAEGLTIGELDMPFGKFFDENDHVYKMLSVCLYEVSLTIFQNFT